MMRRFLALSFAAMLIPTAANAQSDSDNATASIRVLGTVTVTATQDLDFGSWSPAGPATSSAVAARAVWAVALDNPHDVQIEFILPALLDDAGGSNYKVPMTYGTSSARYAGTSDLAFDPATPMTINSADAAFEVLLGEDFKGDGTGDVIADVTGLPASDYAGTIILVVTVL